MINICAIPVPIFCFTVNNIYTKHVYNINNKANVRFKAYY